MVAPIVFPLLDFGAKLIDRFVPDPAAKAKAQMELLRLQQEGEFKELDASLQLALEQSRTNQAEAGSGSRYAGGWRPTIGYVCAAALAYQFLLYPFLTWFAAFWAPELKPPPLITDGLFELVVGMLGLGGLRTLEKVKRVTR